MTPFKTKSLRLVLLIAASGIGLGAAQAQVSGYREDPGTALSRHLRSLSDEPRSLTSLMGAGQAALELGDPQAAATFFARAEEIAPRDGRIKAGIASAFVQMEQAPAALKFFGEATALGVADADVARDRGLAYDLSGNPARAQLDYALVLRKGDDPEVRRRMALSMAISGDRDGALKMIDAQLRQQDRAAWRTRAFVLALTGDAAGATKAAEAVMPAQAAAMRPFFAKLPSLGPAERAMAVHFGHFPGDGRSVQIAGNADSSQYASSGAAADAASPNSGGALARSRTTPEPVSTATRRRPGTEDGTATRAINSQRLAAATQAPAASRPPATVRTQAGTTAATSPARPANQPASSAQTTTQPPATGQAAATAISPSQSKPVASTAPKTAPSSALVGPPSTAAIRTAEIPKSTITPPAPAAADSFAEVVATIAALPDSVKPQGAESEKPAAKPPPAKAAPAAAKKDAAKKPAAPKKAEPKDPSRHWVQIAGGADKGAMAYEFTRLKGKAPKLFAGQSGWTTPLKATNRLLVGPFKTEQDAQAFVNELAKADLTAFSWTSPAGQEIEKLSGN